MTLLAEIELAGKRPNILLGDFQGVNVPRPVLAQPFASLLYCLRVPGYCFAIRCALNAPSSSRPVGVVSLPKVDLNFHLVKNILYIIYYIYMCCCCFSPCWF